MHHLKWISPLLSYAALAVGMFLARSAWAALLAFHLVMIASLRLAKPDIPVSLLLKSTDKKWIVLSLLLCGSSGIVLYLFRSTLGIAPNLSLQLASIGLNKLSWPWFIAYFALVNPWIEEYFWRGYLGSPNYGFYLYDAVFSGYHVLLLIGKVPLGSIILAFALLTLAGWFWRQVTRQDQGLLASAVGHMAADLSILLTVYRIAT
jgi:hypothetical protein